MKKRLIFSAVCFCLACLFLLPSHGFSLTVRSGLREGKPVKYIFLMIGDGMGAAQRALTEAFLDSRDTNGEGRSLLMSRFPAQGLATTNAADRFITDSAAAGTAMACGYKTNVGYIGLDPDLKPLESIAVKAKKKGMKVGIVTSVSLDHATPAAFYARVRDRKMYYEISLELADSGFDFFGGGGLLDPLGKKSKNPRGNAFRRAVRNGYRIVERKKRFMALPENSGKIIAVNRRRWFGEALPYSFDARADDISLAEFTRKAIELLDNPNGFFLMTEGGKIDWAGHANDAATLVQETLAFDEAVKEAYKFYQKHPGETLIVVAADHETGGLSLGFSGTLYNSFFEVLNNQKISFEAFGARVARYRETHSRSYKFEDLSPDFEKYFGLCRECEGIMKLKDHESAALKAAFKKSMSGVECPIYIGFCDPLTIALTRVLSHKAGISWGSRFHTGSPIIVGALGVGADAFNGYYDNIDIAKKIMAVMKIR